MGLQESKVDKDYYETFFGYRFGRPLDQISPQDLSNLIYSTSKPVTVQPLLQSPLLQQTPQYTDLIVANKKDIVKAEKVSKKKQKKSKSKKKNKENDTQDKQNHIEQPPTFVYYGPIDPRYYPMPTIQTPVVPLKKALSPEELKMRSFLSRNFSQRTAPYKINPMTNIAPNSYVQQIPLKLY